MVKIDLSLRQLNLFLRCMKFTKDINFLIKNNSIVIEEDVVNQLENILSAINKYYVRFGYKLNNKPNKIGYELESLSNIFINELKKLKL